MTIDKTIYTAKNDPEIDLGIAIEQAYQKGFYEEDYWGGFYWD